MSEVTTMDNTQQKTAVAVCPDCGTELNENALFCPKCGCSVKTTAEKKTFCTECGAELSASATVCPNCGNPITPLQNVTAVQTSAVRFVPTGKGIIAEGRSSSARKKTFIWLIVINGIGAILSIIHFWIVFTGVSELINEISMTLTEVSDTVNGLIGKVNAVADFFDKHIDFIHLNEKFNNLIYGDTTIVMLLLFLVCVIFFVIVPILMMSVFYRYWSGYRIIVKENGVVIGKMPFKKSVCLAYYSISDVKTDIAGNIAVYSGGKRYVFKDIENSEEICRAINALKSGSISL